MTKTEKSNSISASKNAEKKTKNEVSNNIEQQVQSQTKRSRGRPRKFRTPEELALIEEKRKNKLTLEQKQAIKLEIQKKRIAEKEAKGESTPANESRFYCRNADLREELIKWRDSAKKVEDRVMSERLGEMLLKIGTKLLNHSNFRNYPTELKQDMLMFGVEKIIKGLKNYNFEFANPFSWISMAYFNAYLTIIFKYYRQINIKRDLMKKLSQELETYSGIDPRSSLNKAIKAYLGDDVEVD